MPGRPASLGYSSDGKRRQRTAPGRAMTEVRDKLRELREDISSSVRASAGYSVRQAVEDWLESGLDGRSESTVAKCRSVLKPVVQQIGRAVLRDLTAHDVRRALTVLAREQSSATVAIAHNALTRAIRHPESRDLMTPAVRSATESPFGRQDCTLQDRASRAALSSTSTAESRVCLARHPHRQAMRHARPLRQRPHPRRNRPGLGRRAGPSKLISMEEMTRNCRPLAQRLVDPQRIVSRRRWPSASLRRIGSTRGARRNSAHSS
jgi:hypothetical protein